MNYAKKLLALILLFCMVVNLAPAAFAENDGETPPTDEAVTEAEEEPMPEEPVPEEPVPEVPPDETPPDEIVPEEPTEQPTEETGEAPTEEAAGEETTNPDEEAVHGLPLNCFFAGASAAPSARCASAGAASASPRFSSRRQNAAPHGARP